MTGATGEVQTAANTLVDSAQKVANGVVDLGEEAVGTVLSSLLEANKLIGEAIASATKHITG